MRTVVRRIQRLENQLALSRQALRRFRIIVSRMDRKPSLKGARCTRSLCADGSVAEIIRLDQSESGLVFTDEQLEAWIERFPIERS